MPINLDEVFYKLQSPITSARWSGQDDIVYQSWNQGIIRLSASRMTSEVLLEQSYLVLQDQCMISSDQRYVALLMKTSNRVRSLPLISPQSCFIMVFAGN
ncbi:hypothetical protein GCK32_021503 [Trichostrongylus colubriformis]|uniref:Uncharacterized protein n=1 Tax=Trichostrongylus colubriformis TaxID=6319 RepID=A0AAN8IV83_TRICO